MERRERVKKYSLCRKCMRSLKKVKLDIKAYPAPPCNDCGKDHHSLICPEERKEQMIHKVQDDEEDSDDDSDEEYYGDCDIFEDDIKFHFKHEDNSGDGSLEEYKDGEDQPEGGPENGVAE